MSATPPPKYVAYPRGDNPNRYGSIEQMKALGEGYFGLSLICYANIGLVIAVRAVTAQQSLPILMVCILAIFVIIAVLTYKPNQQIAFGKGWPPRSALYASLLMGLNSALCCGLIGYIVMWRIAALELRKYGLHPGIKGLTRRAFESALQARIQAESEPSLPSEFLPVE